MHRHELTDEQWERFEPLLPPRKGRAAKLGDRNFINAVLFFGKTGVPWRDLPERFGPWKSIFNRFSAWTERGVFARILKEQAKDADTENISADSTYARAHQHSAGGKGGPKFNVLEALAAAIQPKSTHSLTDSEIQLIFTSLPAVFTTAKKLQSSSKLRKGKTSSLTKPTTPMQTSRPSKQNK